MIHRLEARSGAPTVDRLLALGALEHALARASGDPVFLVPALEHTAEALATDPSSLVGLFNRGLIAADLGLCRLAAATWSQYRARDPESKWAAEAAERLDLLPCTNAGAVPESTPNELVTMALEEMLPQWIEARQESLPAARTRLEEMTRAGDRLQALNGDPTIHELAHELTAIEDPGYLAAVAAFTRGRSLYQDERYGDARKKLRPAALALRQYHSCLAPWTGVWLSGIDLYQGRFASAEARLKVLARSPAAARSPYLLGKILWVQGHAAARAGRLQTGYDLASRAEEEFRRGGYSKTAAEVRTLRAEILAHLGFTREAWRFRIPALRALQTASGRFSFFHNSLIDGATFAARAGDYAVADVFLEEAAEVARAQRNTASEAEALLAKAQSLQQRGAYARASKEFERALGSIRAIEPGEVRERFEETALVGLLTDPAYSGRESEAELQDAAAYFAKKGPPSLQLRALRVTAARERRNGDLAASQRTLDRAIAVIRHVQSDIEAEETGIRQLDTSQDLFDEAIDLAVAENQPLRALRLLESVRRARAGEPALIEALKDLRLKAPEPRTPQNDEPVVLVFGLTSRNFIWWRIEGDAVGWGVKEAPPIDAAVRALLDAAPVGRAKPTDLEPLYVALLKDALETVPQGRPLIIVPDGLLQRVPFAALRNPETGVRLIEERAVSLRTSLRVALEQPAANQGQRRAAWRVIAVGDPEFDASRLPFTRLPGAAKEAEEVAAAYDGRAQLILGKAATAAAIRKALRSGEVLHLAAHATVSADGFRDALVLAADPDGGGSGLTAATEILPPSSSCQLVVLSGCSTLGIQPSRSGGLLGLARAYVARGIPATVGTLWPVNDRVLPDLMVDFHRDLLRGDSASEALRQAQLAYLAKNPDACCDWAALQLIGDLPAESASTP
jgi:tetratricopeptide (TPR) repeat protein